MLNITENKLKKWVNFPFTKDGLEKVLKLENLFVIRDLASSPASVGKKFARYMTPLQCCGQSETVDKQGGQKASFEL